MRKATLGTAKVLAPLFCVLLAGRAFGGEPLFGNLVTTDLLPAGRIDLQHGLTGRFDRPGQGAAWQGQATAEYGLSSAVQLAMAALYAAGDSATGTGRARFYDGVAGELLWRMSSPLLDPIGSALLLRPSVGPNLRSVEIRLVAQKNYLDDQLVLAVNAAVQPRSRKAASPGNAPAGWVHGETLTIAVGGSYRFAPSWFAGLELLNERSFASWRPLHRQLGNAYHLGPSLHFGGERVFATLTLTGLLPWTNSDRDVERRRLRVKLGYAF